MQEKEIQLIFDPGQGSVNLRNVTAFCGDKIGTLPTPARRGHVFGGWFTKPDGQGAKITADTTAEASWEGSTILYAYWIAPQKNAKTEKAPVAANNIQEEKLKALEHALADLDKQFGKGSVINYGKTKGDK